MLEINYINYAILSPFTWEFPSLSQLYVLKGEKRLNRNVFVSRCFLRLQDKIVSDLRIILHAKQAGKILENGNKSISLMIYLILCFSDSSLSLPLDPYEDECVDVISHAN
jgi:hypothetical protein